MHNNKMEDFLKGNSDFEELQNANGIDELDNEFVQSYKKLINETNAEIPDFDPFEKINAKKIRRISLIKRTLPYAATIILIFSLYFIYHELQPFNKQNSLSAQELNELKINTEHSLLMFSKELNACIAEIKKTQQARHPLTEMYSFDHFKIEFDNTVKNIKIN